MLKHVIVEGPDGSGKDNLIRLLTKTFGLAIHPRASTSLGGPVDGLTEWHENDLTNLEHPTYGPGGQYGPWVYNRHPLVSEVIYAPIARHEEPRGRFSDLAWVHSQRLAMAEHAIMVWCLPPISHVVANVNKSAHDQMPGVAANIRQIYVEYTKPALLWPGKSVFWDYTRTPYMTLVADMKHAMLTPRPKARIY